MQPTNQLLGVQFRARIRLVTNAVSSETLPISDFLSQNNVLPLFISDKDNVEFYSQALSKLYILDLDVLKLLLGPCFSTTGKPSNQQPDK